MIKESCRSLDVNEEYLEALRTKSYADFFTKAQSLVNQPSSFNHGHQRFSDILLEPGQESIATFLESASFLSRKSDLKTLLFNYFNISAEAFEICSHLLRSINQLQSNYKIVKQVLDTIDDYSHEQLGYIVSKLREQIMLKNPLSDLNRQDFIQIHGKYSLVLQHLKSKQKKIARKVKLIKCLNEASRVRVTTAFLNLNFVNINFMKCGFLRKVGDQLDVAAKGTYILNRDFDTMSILVTRLHDEVEHNKAIIQFFLDRKEDKYSLQILKEFKKNDFGFRKQAEELEEHLYLCLVSINRARALVVKEIAKSCKGNPDQ
ncbi:hypothetical protein ACH5RR_026611 [Cinchona calisaya]|uniref:Uncharacterized protein n=1 Tax=Cinchona calisaya TaxID=153742 RepID=A0ABD2Z539_9GENT